VGNTDSTCCEATCNAHSCQTNWVMKDGVSSTLNPTDDTCCEATCAAHVCGSGNLIEATSTVGNTDDVCCEVVVVGEWVEGTVARADYIGGAEATPYDTEAEAQEVCNANEDCRGIWQGFGGNQWCELLEGERTWLAGELPNDSVVSVKVKPQASLDANGYVAYLNKNAYDNNGAVDITKSESPTGHTVDSCEQLCNEDATCDCITFRSSDGKCWKRHSCVPTEWAGGSNTYDVYLKQIHYTNYLDKNAYDNNGAVDITKSESPTGHTRESCQQLCNEDSVCECITFRESDGKCWTRHSCVPSGFADGGGSFDVFQKTHTVPAS